MSMGFVHSVRVPRLYKSAAKVVSEIRQNGGNFKKLVYEQKHPNVPALYALCLTTLQHDAQLNYLLNKTALLKNESRLDPWLARVLITELLWGKKILKNDSKPVQTILSYENQLQKEWTNISNEKTPMPSIVQASKPRYVRVNTLLLSLDKAISSFKDEGWSLLPKFESYPEYLKNIKTLSKPYFTQDFHIPEILVFPCNTSFHDHHGYQNGGLILQDKASCLATHLLNPEPGSAVLDMCAAPGMKTSHLAAIMKNEGTLYAVERHEGRYKLLCDQVEVTGCTCAKTINTDALTLTTKDCVDVEYILVDPPCSGSGMFDRQLMNEGQKCSPERLKQLQAFQVFLLRHALLNFPKAKRVVYSTCSVNPEENEQVIDEILGNIQDSYKLVSVKKLLKENWINYSSKNYACSNKCLYARSEDDLCNGFFVAVFERDFDTAIPDYAPKQNKRLAEAEEKEEAKEKDEVDVEKSKRIKKKRGKKKKAEQNVAVQAGNNEDIADDGTINDSTQEDYVQEGSTRESNGVKKNGIEEVASKSSTFSADLVKITDDADSEEDGEAPPKMQKIMRQIEAPTNGASMQKKRKKKMMKKGLKKSKRTNDQ